MQRKILVIGLPTESTKVTRVDYADEAPSLFDFDIVIADIDSVLPRWCQSKCPVNDYLEVANQEFSELSKLIERLLKEALYLLEKGGLLVCVMKPKRGLSQKYYNSERRSNSHYYANNYD